MEGPIKINERDKLYAEAMLKSERGDFSAAVEALSVLTTRYPDHGKARASMGDLMQYRFGDLESAETCYKKAIEADSSLATAYSAYADVLMSRQRFPEANAMVNKALSLNGPGLDNALYKSGLFRESQSRFDEAIEAYRKAILATFSDDIIISCEKGIHRCEVKRKYQ